MASSLEVSMQGLADGLTAFLADANIWNGPLDHSEAKNKLTLVSVQLTSAGGMRDASRIKDRISEIKFHLQKMIVDNETERRLSAIRPVDGRLSYSLNVTDKLLLKVADVERAIASDAEGSFFRVPPQSSAPIRVAVSGDVLRMDRSSAAKTKESAPNLAGVSRYLSNEYKKIEEQLSKTNLDRRFLELFSNLEGLFADTSDVSVISLGMHVAVVGQAFVHVRDEMPTLLAAEVSGYVVNVRGYVNQFEDWQLFVKNASSEDMSKIDINELATVIKNVKSKLESNNSIIAIEIPSGISFILTALHHASESIITITFAVIKSIENVFIGILKYLFDKLKELGSKSIDNTVEVFAKGAPYAFALLLVSAYPDLLPIVQKVTSLSWLDDAIKLIEAVLKRR